METIASWPHMATICRSFFDYTVGKRFQVMGHGIKVRSKFWDTPMLMLKPLPQYGWKLATRQTQKSAVILGMSQKYKPPLMNRGNGKSTIHRFVSHEKSPFISGFSMIFPRHWRLYCGIPHFDLFSSQHLEHHSGDPWGLHIRNLQDRKHLVKPSLDGHEMVDFQDPKEPPQLMLPEVIALSTLAMVFRLGTFQEFILVRWLPERNVIFHDFAASIPFGQLTDVFEHGWTMCLRMSSRSVLPVFQWQFARQGNAILACDSQQRPEMPQFCGSLHSVTAAMLANAGEA